MRTKAIVLSLVTTAIMNMNFSFAQTFNRMKSGNVAKSVRFELFPVKLSKGQSKEGFDYEGKSLLPMTKKPIAVLEDFEYQTFTNNGGGIMINVDEKVGKVLDEISHKYKNHRLAFVLNGKVVNAPQLKDTEATGEFKLTMNDPRKFAQFLTTLEQVVES